jgi:two-component system response regulator RegX3
MGKTVELLLSPEQKQMGSADFFRQNFFLSPISIAIIDDHGLCILVNQAFKNLFKKEIEDSDVDLPFHIGQIFENQEILEAIQNDIKQRDVIRRREVQLRDRDGNRLEMLLSARSVRFEGDPAIELSLVDIWKQKKLQQRLRQECARLESLLESLDVGLFLVGNKGVLREVNEQLWDYLGIEAERYSCKTYHHLFSNLISIAEEPELLQHSLERAMTAINERPVVEFELASDTPRYLQITFFPVFTDVGELFGWGGLVQDVTEVRERLSWKLEMLSVLSHDIRAPLATLKGQTTALLANFRHWGEDLNIDFLEGINRSTDKLIHQVERSLALTRVEAGRLGLRPEACKPENIINQSLERISGLLDNAKVKMELAPDLPDVRVDPARVEEVIINLLENALRYSPSDQPIIIGAELKDPMLEISVTDRGYGVPKEKQAGLFEKYVRADHERDGSGLGLYISRKIVEAHGGRIRVESPPKGEEEGARFVFTLPIMPPEVKVNAFEKEMEKVSEEGKEKGLRVLVVEDEPDFQALLSTILRKEGYQVEVAPDGSTAMDIVHIASPDIILLDWMMPGMSGLSTCRNIRRWTDAPILMVTSRTAQEDLIAALDAGADDYLTKPFKTPEFLARIHALARRRSTWVVAEPERVTIDGLSIDFDTFEVWRSGERVELTPTEFELLAYLVRNRGHVLTYDQLMDHLYGGEKDRNRHDLFVHISRLRKKIEPDPEEPRYILTQWGVGYLFETK